MVSWASQAPLAYWKKSVHAFAVVSIHRMSTTLSGLGITGRPFWAAATIGVPSVKASAASSDFRLERRDIGTWTPVKEGGIVESTACRGEWPSASARHFTFALDPMSLAI